MISSCRSGQQTLMSDRRVFKQKENFSVPGIPGIESGISANSLNFNCTHCQFSSLISLDRHLCELTSVIPSEVESNTAQSNSRSDIHFLGNTSRERRLPRVLEHQCRKRQLSSLEGKSEIVVVTGSGNFQGQIDNFCNFRSTRISRDLQAYLFFWRRVEMSEGTSETLNCFLKECVCFKCHNFYVFSRALNIWENHFLHC